MIFQSEKKKKLWRYASRNNPATCDADGIPTPMQQQQPLHPPHQRHLQSCGSFCCCYADQSSLMMMRQPNSPSPPPYSSIPSIDCSGSYRPTHKQPQLQLMSHPNGQEDISVSASATEESNYSYIKDGCSYASSGAGMLVDENRFCPEWALPMSAAVPMPMPACSNAHSTTAAATFATTAAKMFRNCCGGGGDSSSSSNSSSGTTTDFGNRFFSKANPVQSKRHSQSRQRTASFTPTCPMHTQSPTLSPAGAGSMSATALRLETVHQNFDALLKKLKSKQIADLLQAVRSRVDPPHKRDPPDTSSYLQCILIKCSLPIDKGQHVTTCQLFLWSDLMDAGELRRLPTCPSARDSVYICCNPLHWYRINYPIDSESAPPPYQRSKMLRLRDQDTEEYTQNNNESSSMTAWAVQSNSNNNSNSIIKQSESQLYVPSLESFTTDGKDHSANNNAWCQIAYWELSQRVGDLFHARRLAVNIHTDGPVDCTGENMCLREFCGKQTSSDAVQKTRLKIGLGVTLSLECGDVWIYNRSNVPIFVDSPTLAERLDRVCKLMPGYCLKAFETHRAQWLAEKQMEQTHLGPIDRFSMKISFAKGWGNMYRRQDIMCCPCWLEVHFSHLR
ncbi:PREDICTED: mothers against decapentaplegic homolog 6 [Drosophila arizonae]|uniref:Mothers against decapentaplegic homolog n=1 Tax=Drosophila arizonae TaxID=7263 RepID=A0ABM1Q1F8_DROAR|nr:PREDICTED: mothers against decapentaplegic homolog 6 [Drosophila arizonae]